MFVNLSNAFHEAGNNGCTTLGSKIWSVLTTDDTQTLIEGHALAASTAFFGLSHIPDAGYPISLATITCITYHLYARINKSNGIKISKKILVCLPRIILSNIAGNLFGSAKMLLLALISSNIPILNNIPALEMSAAIYTSIQMAGIVYDETIKRVAARASSMSTEDFKEELETTAKRTDITNRSKKCHDNFIETKAASC